MEWFNICCFLFSCTLLVVAIDPNDCDIDVSGTCFVIIHEKMKWEEARTKCQDLGGNLAVLDKINVRDAVNTITVGGESLWIGLHDLAINGQPFWVDPEVIYNSNKVYPWAIVDDNTDNRDCVLATGNQEGVLEWRYNNCGSLHAFLCEILGSDDDADMEIITANKLKAE
ncbi:snaclec bothroinsularin subunit beta-like [Saccoglossus kowalevskii]|uniref:CD209 antigen-like protein 2-like n=1 Tax=Saccoglossus kowalevskii TaxID=10224 RepID=A0ABM0LU71_SACKO|nr:PREDICTED: CD209 antigen-like protein 2-like [Saccoglossus kowalevskii]